MPSSCRCELRIESLKTRHRQTGDDGKSDNHLGEDHRCRRVDQLQETERAAAPQEDRDKQTDHHRRQAHTGIDQSNRRVAAGEPRKRKGDAKRHTDQKRN